MSIQLCLSHNLTFFFLQAYWSSNILMVGLCLILSDLYKLFYIYIEYSSLILQLDFIKELCFAVSLEFLLLLEKMTAALFSTSETITWLLKKACLPTSAMKPKDSSSNCWWLIDCKWNLQG